MASTIRPGTQEELAKKINPKSIENFLFDFLRFGEESGPYVLHFTAFHPTTYGRKGQSFSPRVLKKAVEWIVELNENGWNVYFNVNEPRKNYGSTTKLSKDHIGCVHMLHVDLDPPEGITEAGKPLAQWKGKAERQIDAVLRKHGISAHIVDSGGGFGIFAPLTQPFKVGSYGDVAYIEDLCARLHAIFRKVGKIDGTHNIDRVMRVPYTINYPDAKKREKGRQETRATWRVEAGGANALAAFEALPASTVQQKARVGAVAGKDYRNTGKLLCEPEAVWGAYENLREWDGNQGQDGSPSGQFASLLRTVLGGVLEVLECSLGELNADDVCVTLEEALTYALDRLESDEADMAATHMEEKGSRSIPNLVAGDMRGGPDRAPESVKRRRAVADYAAAYKAFSATGDARPAGKASKPRQPDHVANEADGFLTLIEKLSQTEWTGVELELRQKEIAALRGAPSLKTIKDEFKRLRRERTAERREAVNEKRAGEFEDDGSLDIHPDVPFDVCVKRALKRYVLLQEGSGTDAHVGDMTMVGEKLWSRPLQKLRSAYANIFTTVETEDGKFRRLTLMDEWFFHPKRDTALATRFLPTAKPGHFREEMADGAVEGFINTYRPPVHPKKGGETDTFHEFMEHLLPIEDEREWYLDREAYKLQNPGARGPAVIMVAPGLFGTGRGTLWRIRMALFGAHHTKAVSFDEFCGRGTAGQWNDWAEGKLIVGVAEARDNEQTGRHYDKLAAYETLKGAVDPGQTRTSIRKRNTSSYDTDVFFDVDISTNHPDAMFMPPDDRRCAVFSNGEKMPDDLKERINAWKCDPKNIGALYREMLDRDVRHYSPYADPPMTSAKQRMIDSSMSPEEAAMFDLLNLAKEQDFDLVTRAMAEEYISEHMLEHGANDLRDPKAAERMNAVIKRHTQKLPRDHDRAGTGNNRKRCFALRNVDAWGEKASNSDRTEELERAQDAIAEQRKRDGKAQNSNVYPFTPRRSA